MDSIIKWMDILLNIDNWFLLNYLINVGYDLYLCAFLLIS